MNERVAPAFFIGTYLLSRWVKDFCIMVSPLLRLGGPIGNFLALQIPFFSGFLHTFDPQGGEMNVQVFAPPLQ